MYFVLVLVTLVLLFGINRIENRLDSQVAEHNLRFTGQIKNAPPVVVFTTVALGSFRGLVADLLWLRAGALQEKAITSNGAAGALDHGPAADIFRGDRLSGLEHGV